MKISLASGERVCPLCGQDVPREPTEEEIRCSEEYQKAVRAMWSAPESPTDKLKAIHNQYMRDYMRRRRGGLKRKPKEATDGK